MIRMILAVGLGLACVSAQARAQTLEQDKEVSFEELVRDASQGLELKSGGGMRSKDVDAWMKWVSQNGPVRFRRDVVQSPRLGTRTEHETLERDLYTHRSLGVTYSGSAFARYAQCALDIFNRSADRGKLYDTPYFAPCFPHLGATEGEQVKLLSDILSDAEDMAKIDATQSDYLARGLGHLSAAKFLSAADQFMTNCVRQKMYCNERTGSYAILFLMSRHKNSAGTLLPMFKRYLEISSSDQHDWPAMSARVIWNILTLQSDDAKDFVKSLAAGTNALSKSGQRWGNNQSLAEMALESYPKFPARGPY